MWELSVSFGSEGVLSYVLVSRASTADEGGADQSRFLDPRLSLSLSLSLSRSLFLSLTLTLTLATRNRRAESDSLERKDRVRYL